MFEQVEGVKITRPGFGYYFDDGDVSCPLCNSPDVVYRGRVDGKPATISLKCKACNAKFEKSRTIPCDYYHNPEDVVVEIAPAVNCGHCGTSLQMSTYDFENAEKVVCPGCHKVCKDRVGEADVEPEDTDED